MNVMNLVWEGVLQPFIVALFHDKVSDLNFYHTLMPLLASLGLQWQQEGWVVQEGISNLGTIFWYISQDFT